jgi:hypothetical protein
LVVVVVVVVVVPAEAVIVRRLGRRAVLEQTQRSLADLVWTAVRVVRSVLVLGLRSAVRHWWWARERLPWCDIDSK